VLQQRNTKLHQESVPEIPTTELTFRTMCDGRTKQATVCERWDQPCSGCSPNHFPHRQCPLQALEVVPACGIAFLAALLAWVSQKDRACRGPLAAIGLPSSWGFRGRAAWKGSWRDDRPFSLDMTDLSPDPVPTSARRLDRPLPVRTIQTLSLSSTSPAGGATRESITRTMDNLTQYILQAFSSRETRTARHQSFSSTRIDGPDICRPPNLPSKDRRESDVPFFCTISL